MNRVKVAHLSSVHPHDDPRVGIKECSALRKAGYEVVLVSRSSDHPPVPRLTGRLNRLSSIGSTTTLYCSNSSGTVPVPPGGNFSSGAPNIVRAGNSIGTFILIAK